MGRINNYEPHDDVLITPEERPLPELQATAVTASDVPPGSNGAPSSRFHQGGRGNSKAVMLYSHGELLAKSSSSPSQLSPLPEPLETADNRHLHLAPSSTEYVSPAGDADGSAVSTRNRLPVVVPVMRETGEGEEKSIALEADQTLPPAPGLFKMIVMYRGSSKVSKRVIKLLRCWIGDLRTEKARRQTERALHCIVTNLGDWLGCPADERPQDGIALSLAPESYVPKNVTNPDQLDRWVTHAALKRALSWLDRHGLIEIDLGRAKFGCGSGHKTAALPGMGKLTRIRPAPALEALWLEERALAGDASPSGSRRLAKGRATEDELATTQDEADALFNLGQVTLKTKDEEDSKAKVSGAGDVLHEALTERLWAFNSQNANHQWVMKYPGYGYLGSPFPGTEHTRISAPSLIYNKVFNRVSTDGGLVFSYNYNGRYYSPLTNIKRHHRQYLEVNGSSLVEADFVSLHIRLAYDLEYLQMPTADCYDLSQVGERYLGHLEPSLRRQLVKSLMLALINKQKPARGQSLLLGLDQLLHGSYRGGRKQDGMWNTNLRKIRDGISHKVKHGIPLSAKDQLDYPERWDWEKDVKPAVAAIQEYHHTIADKYLGDDWGLYFQHLDSRIADIIAYRFTELEKPLLILHDGFFTAVEDEALLLATMQAAYAEVIGVELPANAIETKHHIESRGH